MFRQDRTNPSTAVSTWNGRRDLPKANPSTAVSAWMNGGLGGAGIVAPTAWGGIISTYEDSGKTYRVHTFLRSANFEMASGSADAEVEYVIIAGGGGGGGRTTQFYHGGGGGAGGMQT